MSRLAQETWDTCQSHSGQDTEQLPALAPDVRVLPRADRAARQRPPRLHPALLGLHLQRPAKRGVVPLEFRSPDDPVFGVLYRPDRSELANGGQPIQSYNPGDPMRIGGADGQGVLRNGRQRRRASAGRSTPASTAASTCWSATRRTWARCPTPARDPLFWVHHSNIDRMWASWNSQRRRQSGRRAVGATELRVRGCRWTRRPRRSATSSIARRSAMRTTPTFHRPAAPPRRWRRCSTQGADGAGGQGAYGRRTRRAARARYRCFPKPARKPSARSWAWMPAGPAQRTFLKLKDLHTWAQPEVLYHVYLGPAHGGRIDERQPCRLHQLLRCGVP